MSDMSIGGGASYYAQAIQQLEQRLFGQIDTSGSGSINKSELEKAVTAAGGTTTSADALYQQLDPNNTGSISEQQFAQNLPLPIFSPEVGSQLIFAQAQTSGTGADPRTQINENLYQQLTGGSGSLTKSELEQAVTAAGGTTASADALYAKLDPNNTGSVSEQQFLQNLPQPHLHHHHHGGDASASDASQSDPSGDGSSTGTDGGNSAQDALMALLDSLLQQNGATASNTSDGSSQTGSNGTGTTGATATSTTTSSNSAQSALFDLINSLDPSFQTTGTGTSATNGNSAQSALFDLIDNLDSSAQTAAGTSTTGTGNSADDALMALLNASTGTADASAASTATSADAASNQNSTPASLFGMFNQQILALMLQMQSQSIAA